jgi:hypothetical protein
VKYANDESVRQHLPAQLARSHHVATPQLLEQFKDGHVVEVALFVVRTLRDVDRQHDRIAVDDAHDSRRKVLQ